MPLLSSMEKNFASRATAAHTITIYCHSLREEQQLLLELAAYLHGKLVIEEEQHDEQENHKLTYTENIVFTLLLEGFSDKQISDKLSIVPGTVHLHRKHIYAKLKVHNESVFFKRFLPRNFDDNVAF